MTIAEVADETNVSYSYNMLVLALQPTACCFIPASQVNIVPEGSMSLVYKR